MPITLFQTLTPSDTSDGYPCLVAAPSGARWAVWKSFDGVQDVVLAQQLDGDASAVALVSGEGQALHPAASCDADGNLWVTWAAWRAGHWQVCVRASQNGEWGPIEILAEGPARGAGYPAIAAGTGMVWVAWCDLGPDSRLHLARRQGEAWHEVDAPSFVGQARRPGLAPAPDGSLWLFADVSVEAHYVLAGAQYSAGAWSDAVRVEPMANGLAGRALAAAAADGSLCVAWIEVGPNCQHYYRLRRRRDGAWAETYHLGPFTHPNLHHSLALDDRGKAIWAYTFGGRVHVRREGNGQLSAPVVVAEPKRYLRRPALAPAGDGRWAVAWQSAPSGGHCASRHSDIRYAPDLSAFGAGDPQAENAETSANNYFASPYRRREPVVPALGAAEPAPPASGPEGYGAYRLVWGDIHGHSALTDAVGEVDQYFAVARWWARMDVTALTDHDCFPDPVTASEWALIQGESAAWNTPEEFAVLLGYEWTSNEFRHDHGHRCVYYRGADGHLLRCTDALADTADKLLAALTGQEAVVIPHHVSATWGYVSAATDWDYHADAVERAVEIFSTHGDYETLEACSPFTHNAGKLPGKSVRDALGRGYRMGLVAGSDSHQLEHGVAGGLVGFYAADLTREAVFDALMARRVYATTGARIRLLVSVGEALMGEALQVRPGACLPVVVAVSGSAPLASIELMSAAGPIFSVSPNGPAGRLEHTVTPEDDAYYYVRVTQTDDHRAWSSPVWVSMLPAPASHPTS